MGNATECPICGPDYPHDRHYDDSYGSCVVCREAVPHTDDETVLVKWPCAVERLRRLQEGCQCPPVWHGVVPPPCALHNPMPLSYRSITTSDTRSG